MRECRESGREGMKVSLWMRVLGSALCGMLLASCSVGSLGEGQSSQVSKDRLVTVSNGLCRDTKTGLYWQTVTSKTLRSLKDADDYSTSLESGGYDDWRLPTVSELFELYMTFDLHENGDCRMVVEGTYWSDEPDLEGRVGTWELDDNCDPERRYIPQKKGKVRAVRP